VVLAGHFPRATHRMRALWARLNQTWGGSSAVLLQGAASGDLGALLSANALVLVPPGSPPLPPGSRVAALLLDQDEDRDHLTITPPRPGPLVIGVVGESGSGKTTVIADLVRKLTGCGVRAVAVKHAAHGFDLDREGSDSARMAAAGAALVVLAGPAETLIRIAAPLRNPDLAATLAAVIAEHVWAAGPALVLVEGFQHPSSPVIMVGPQKTGSASEVLATVPAVHGMNGDRLAAELQRVLDAVLCRMRAPHATEKTERPRD